MEILTNTRVIGISEGKDYNYVDLAFKFLTALIDCFLVTVSDAPMADLQSKKQERVVSPIEN